jgi:DNA-binding transcriptional ArsR family regulator
MAGGRNGPRDDEANSDASAKSDAAAASPPPGYVEERTVTDLETLRVLADPLRLSIIGAFPTDISRRHPMSVKEIAERIDEGQTKLYRHVKKLEDVGLIYVAETRVVSGIIEKRYLPAQKRLVFSGTLLGQQAEQEDLTDTFEALMDAVRDRLRTEIRAGRVQLSPPPDGPDLTPQIGSIRVNMTLERYLKLQAAVLDLIDNIGPSDEGPDTFPVQLHAVLFATSDPPDSDVEEG